MTVESPNAALVLLATLAALHAAHEVGDHWLQTCFQAEHKGQPGWVGRLACAAHVAVYSLAGVVALAAVAALGVPLTAAGSTAAVTVSAVTHYVADRRTPLLALARFLGRGGYLDAVGVVRVPGGPADRFGPGTAAFHLDQSWHRVWLFVAALAAAIPSLT